MSAGILFGVFNFLFGAISYLGVGASYLYCTGAIFVTIVFTLYSMLKTYRKRGKLWTRNHSHFFVMNGNGYDFKWANLIGLIVRTILLFLALLLTIYTYKEAAE